MPLTWNAQVIPEADRKDPLFQQAIWNLMVIRIGSLTEKTLAEAIVRTRIHEGLNGPWYYTANGTPVYLWSELHRFVGLKTNVTYEPRSKWLKWHYEVAVKEAQQALENERRVREEQEAEELTTA